MDPPLRHKHRISEEAPDERSSADWMQCHTKRVGTGCYDLVAYKLDDTRRQPSVNRTGTTLGERYSRSPEQHLQRGRMKGAMVP